jgi:hypothetical protein
MMHVPGLQGLLVLDLPNHRGQEGVLKKVRVPTVIVVGLALVACAHPDVHADWPTTVAVDRSSTAPASTWPSPPTADDIRSFARQAAKTNEEDHPTEIEWTMSSLDAAQQFISGDIGDFGNDNVITIQVHGQFEANLASRPANAAPPTGSALIMMVDPATGTSRGGALLKVPVDLGLLGKVSR